MSVIFREGDKAMRYGFSIGLLTCLLAAFVPIIHAQNANHPGTALEDLRVQLRDVQAKEAELQTRAKQLDDDLKPENIERSLAGIGSTRPEELREFRRSQLSREKASVLTQLELLSKSRARLETAIVAAEAAAYQQSAQPPPVEQIVMLQSRLSTRLLAMALAGVIAILGVAAVIIVVRKLRRA